MDDSTPDTFRYAVTAQTAGSGTGEIAANDATIAFNREWPTTECPSLPAPAELLAAAFAACAIKNIERFSQVLPFAYDSAENDVELHRADQPSHFDRIDHVLRIASDEPAARVDLLARNLACIAGSRLGTFGPSPTQRVGSSWYESGASPPLAVP